MYAHKMNRIRFIVDVVKSSRIGFASNDRPILFYECYSDSILVYT